MKITDLAETIADATGAEGAELETLTFLCAAVYADAMGNKVIGDYFARRMNDAAEKWQRRA